MNRTVAVIGASSNSKRYSCQAVELLLEHGYTVVPVHPRAVPVCGLATKASLAELAKGIDTFTMYVNSGRSDAMAEEILRLAPRRIIFNPGAENAQLRSRCEAAGIETVEGCTLVMLKTGQF